MSLYETKHYTAESLKDFYLIKDMRTNGVVGQLVNGEFRRKMFAVFTSDERLEIMNLIATVNGGKFVEIK